MHRRASADPIWMKHRREIAEHPFGTMKWLMAHPRFLVRGLEKSDSRTGPGRAELQSQTGHQHPRVPALLQALEPPQPDEDFCAPQTPLWPSVAKKIATSRTAWFAGPIRRVISFWQCADTVRHNQRPGLWVPAFAGTTHTHIACVVLASPQDRPLNLPKADAVAVALAPAAYDQRIAVFEKCPDDAARQLDRLGAVPADFKQAAALVLVRAADGAAA